MTDASRNTCWSTDDTVTHAELLLDLGRLAGFNVACLRELLPLGRRIEAFALDQWQDQKWMAFASGSSIGDGRRVRGENLTTDKVRRRRVKAPVCPAINEHELFAEKS